jgi:hypothetical protein
MAKCVFYGSRQGVLTCLPKAGAPTSDDLSCGHPSSAPHARTAVGEGGEPGKKLFGTVQDQDASTSTPSRSHLKKKSRNEAAAGAAHIRDDQVGGSPNPTRHAGKIPPPTPPPLPARARGRRGRTCATVTGAPPRPLPPSPTTVLRASISSAGAPFSLDPDQLPVWCRVLSLSLMPCSRLPCFTTFF